MTFSTNHRDLGDFSAFWRGLVMVNGLRRRNRQQKSFVRQQVTRFRASRLSIGLPMGGVTAQGADRPTFCANQPIVYHAVDCPNAAPTVTRTVTSPTRSQTNGTVFVLASFAVFAASNTVFYDFA